MPTESKTEQLLNAYINGDDINNFIPLSRNEQILKDMILGNEQTSSPQSRIESLYKKLDEKIKNNSGKDINPLQYIIDNQDGDGKPSCSYLFYNYKGTSLDDAITKVNIGSCTNMSYMFYDCPNLTTIPQLDTSKVTNMSYMFYNCSNLTTIPQLDTSKVTNMYEMFIYCKELISMPQLDTSSCTNMGEMFNYCRKLKTIDITHMKPRYTSGISLFAGYCYSLTKLIIRNMDTIPVSSSDTFKNCYHFYGTQNDTYNPEGLKDGRIYVPDDKVDELKVATNWSVFADIIVPLSTLVEE